MDKTDYKLAYDYIYNLINLDDESMKWPLTIDSMNIFKELVDEKLNEPTLEQVKKMWEENGWKVSEDGYFETITFIKGEKGIEFDIKDKTYFTFQKELEHNSFDIDCKLHALITKTIKALEKEKQ